MASTSNQSSSWDHDVFLSFRGPDTRNGFTSHLHEALKGARIRTFMDSEELPAGNEIKPELRKAIRRSKMSIIVFSKNYASSRWCLDELVEILECRRSNEQIVLPIFYDVEPYVVRHQKESYAEAFANHSANDKLDVQQVSKWRVALIEASNLSGHSLKHEESGNEARFIQKIIEEVQRKVDIRCLELPENLVGIDSHVKCLFDLLSAGSDGVGVIGIYGMGGVGKTTVSKAVFNKYRQMNHFQHTAYVDNIKDVSKQADGQLRLQEKLLVQLGEKDVKLSNNDEGINKIKRLCQSRSVLLLLDDFDEFDQISNLAGQKSWFGTGSKIILVTRDAKLLKEAQVQHTYEMRLLNEEESLNLFRKHALEDDTPSQAQDSLSIDIAKYCQGLPLALVVIGRHLRGESLKYWENALEEFKSTPDKTVYDRLKISYDALDGDRKNVFCDSACFLIGWNREHVIAFWNGCGFCKNSVSDLENKCLLKFDEYNCLWMHDLLRDMGRKIVNDASGGSFEKQSRLWINENVLDLLRHIKHLPNLKFLDLSHSKWLEESSDFSGTPSLKRLILKDCRRLKRIHPSICLLKSLVQLNLESCVELTSLPTSICSLTSLEELNLSYCYNLRQLPEQLGKMECLQTLNLRSCHKIRHVPKSICNLTALQILNLSYCDELECLPEGLGNLVSLKELNVSSCSKFLPLGLGNLKSLMIFHANNTPLEELPDSIGHLTSLVELRLYLCVNMKTLPDSICDLSSLQLLYINYCSRLQQLPDRLGDMVSLRHLYALHTRCKRLPGSINNLKELETLAFSQSDPQPNDLSEKFVMPSNSSLKRLTLENCGLRDEDITDIWMGLSSLQSLNLSGNNFCNPSLHLHPFSNLTELDLSCCTNLVSLPKLPPNLEMLKTRGCISLKVVPNLSNLQCLRTLDLGGCKSLVELQDLENLKQLRSLELGGCNSLARNGNINESFFQRYFEYGGECTLPLWEIPDWIKYKSMESTITFHLPHKFKGIIFWVLYDNPNFYAYSNIRNNTTGMSLSCGPPDFRVGVTWVFCLKESDWMPVRSGDSITISISGGMKAEGFGVHCWTGNESSEENVGYSSTLEMLRDSDDSDSESKRKKSTLKTLLTCLSSEASSSQKQKTKTRQFLPRKK